MKSIVYYVLCVMRMCFERKSFLVLFLPIILATYYILHTATPAFAQTPTPVLLPATVSPTSPVYTDLLVHNLFHSFSCLATGSSIIGQPCLTYQVTRNAQGVIQSIPVLSQTNLSGGALGATTSLIAALYMNPPVRTVDYLASLGESFGLVKEAKAQVVGSGALVLNPILSLWTVSRNISYLVMIIIFVIVGLMVMFRNRINPQTVITAQAALPGLVIGLIMITFSYFFAALLTDTAFIGTNIVGYYFSSAQGATQPNLVDATKTENVLSIFSRYTGLINQSNAKSALDSIWPNFDNNTRTVIITLATFVAASTTQQATEFFKAIPGVGAGIQAFFTTGAVIAAQAFPTTTIGTILAIIATAILIYSMFKLLLRLINNYISIIFLTIIAPFQFLASSLPGRQDIATGWVLNMLCNILAFPAVMAAFYFVAYLLGNDAPNRFIPTYFIISGTAAVTNERTLPLLGNLDLSFIKLLLAFGVLIASPTIPDIICRTIGRVTQAGQLIGQEISGGVSAGRGYTGQFHQGVGNASSTLAQGRQLAGSTGWEQTAGGWTKSPQFIHGARPNIFQKAGIAPKPK